MSPTGRDFMSPTGNVTNWQFSQLPVGDINLHKSMSPTGRDFMSPTGNHPSKASA